LPCRRWLLKQVDRVFLVSEHAHSYLLSCYPETVDRLAVSRLGTPEPGFLAAASNDGILRVVSCSAFMPVKQVDLLARGLVLAAGHRPDRTIEWHHFGDGQLRRAVEALLRGSAPSNLSWAFPGHVSNAEIFGHYRSHPADLFANASQTEGIPVTIMEAQSCGIPVMAPGVGGVPEAVSPENGFLLPSPATPAGVADVVGSVLGAAGLLAPRRACSRRSWEARFQARRNFADFARTLSGLRRQLSAATA
jgi:glycosyltransferase involved in cell wall biosynthesis